MIDEILPCKTLGSRLKLTIELFYLDIFKSITLSEGSSLEITLLTFHLLFMILADVNAVGSGWTSWIGFKNFSPIRSDEHLSKSHQNPI